ncbi:outer membrane protein assembly factor BamC [Gilvimarinus agarilyticus]|uniref:outer membrane protein assembly factor BamC n=1 Tax=Gilvimarinus agarilyticus TaxID=679259 RepID=UPI00059FC1BC|nr:outer membrane protein assembly factor BamC [Gilvimarinus agarilyticus]
MIKTTSLRGVSVLGLVAMLSGCGVLWGDEAYFRNREGDYQKADNIEPLKVPQGMQGERLGERYPIPPITESEFDDIAQEGGAEVPRPQPLATNLMQENVKIQRLADERWILMNVSPGEVWPRVRAFLNENNVDVASADIERGLIDSYWLQFKSDLSTSDRYRVQIDQGVQPETSEIHVLHQSVKGDSPSNDLQWPKASSSTEREAWLLDELAAALARDETIGGTSLLAQAIGGDAKSALVVEQNEPVMKIRLSEARAKATLYHAMRQDGFAMYDSQPDDGVYYLHYQPVEPEDDGWFSGWFSSDKELVAESPYSVAQLLTVVPQGESFAKAPLSNRGAEQTFPDAPGYLLFVEGESNNYTVRLRDPYGKRLDPRKSRDLLTLLRKNLI